MKTIDLGSIVLEHDGFNAVNVRLATDSPRTSSIYGPFAQLILDSEEAAAAIDLALDEDLPEELDFDEDS